MTWRALSVLVTVSALFVLVPPVYAQPDDAIGYRVKQGDTLEMIAAELYGDRGHASWIAAENKLKGNKLTHGDRLKLPVSHDVVTAKGDTFESLASTYLGDASRAPYLAEANAMSIEDGLAAGTTIVIPLHVLHVAQASESLANIAQQYLGNPKHAAMLQKLNGLDHTTIEKGEAVLVLDLAVRVPASKLPPPDAEARARRDHQHKVAMAAADALPRAKAAWLQGDFDAVRTTLAPFAEGDMDYLDARTAVELGILAGKAHVAFGETDAAASSFAQVLARRPRLTISGYAESPKVIAAWQKAGGRVASN
jgi:LysM repeat protein